ncbi:hypothetical protein H4Q26_014868 [Puccinia striiformis f. sp. tritici PST-130]|nr:hypothetical protein H4Q26_014868 [Puccinia striiformis f. sp. tritici PST-130]
MGDGTPFLNKIGSQIVEVSNDGQHNSITLPNPWREKAKGKIICHAHITLYADDTSVLACMEYNIHFISTSNVAGPLELAESIVNQLNELATEGSFAYDCTLQKEKVLFMTVPPCFLADSPMAAEITNTPIPGNCNNPCRICKLKAVEASDRRVSRTRNS